MLVSRRTFFFGSLALPTPLLLSPLAGYTNLPFRRVIREVGSVGLCTTDLVNARWHAAYGMVRAIERGESGDVPQTVRS